MPFVNVRILEGHSQQRKDEMSRRITDAKDGVGFISKVSPDGKMVEAEWVKGLNAPKGLVMSGDKLYVSDVDQLVEIDVNSGKVTNTWTAEGSQFLNDTAADSAGRAHRQRATAGRAARAR